MLRGVNSGADATGEARQKETPPKVPNRNTSVLPLDEAALPFRVGRVLYQNPLSRADDVKDFRREGEIKISFANGRMRLQNALPLDAAQPHFLFWCPQDFPWDIEITWEFQPLSEPGLAMMFFGAAGKNGEDLFDPSLKKRDGTYKQYTYGDINAFHASYFRRGAKDTFYLCNLRKSSGFHLVAQGADPIPGIDHATVPYQMRLTKFGGNVRLFIDDLPIFSWDDDGKANGPPIGGGKIGFRQMAPLSAEYTNLRVRELVAAPVEN